MFGFRRAEDKETSDEKQEHSETGKPRESVLGDSSVYSTSWKYLDSGNELESVELVLDFWPCK